MSSDSSKLDMREAWHKNGQIWIREVFLNGEWCERTEWYDDKGQRTGKYQINHSNGNPEMYRVQNGQFEGEVRNWLSNGTLSKYCYLRNDREIDSFFNIAKKLEFLRLKNFYVFVSNLEIFTSF